MDWLQRILPWMYLYDLWSYIRQRTKNEIAEKGARGSLVDRPTSRHNKIVCKDKKNNKKPFKVLSMLLCCFLLLLRRFSFVFDFLFFLIFFLFLCFICLCFIFTLFYFYFVFFYFVFFCFILFFFVFFWGFQSQYLNI